MSNVGAIWRISPMSSAVVGVGVDMPSRRSREPVIVISSGASATGVGCCALAAVPQSDATAKAVNPMSSINPRRLEQMELTAAANFEARLFA